MALNDASLPRGVPQKGETALHAGHQTGLEIDLRLPRTDGLVGGVTPADPKYDRDAMRAQLKALRAQPLVSTILFSDAVLVGEGLCTAYAGHDDHAHVRISPPVRGGPEAPPVAGGQSWSSALSPATSFDVNIPGTIAPLAQPSSMTCWATVTAMMLSWRDQTSYTIAGAMDRLGGGYRTAFDGNQGLRGSDKPALLAAAGLRAEPPMSWSVDAFLRLLRAHGPLWVTTDEDPSAAFAVHARIVTGMVGDGTPGGTRLRLMDPNGGRTYDETFADFHAKFTAVAVGDIDGGAEPRVQIVHF